MTLDVKIARAKKASENQPEKSDSYQRLETNLDHYKDEILESCLDGLADALAVVKGRPKLCYKINCNDCEFYKDKSKDCIEDARDWLKQPYIKPAYKLTKFENDLLQSYLKSSLLSGYEFKSIVILKRMKGKGYFKGVDEDATVEDILADCEITEED